MQYNVRNDRVSTKLPLLADPNTQDYDIIAIQEPWRNPSALTTLSPHQSGFHLLYRPSGETRVCFYISDSIDPDSWEVKFPSPDMCTLIIRTKIGETSEVIHIHNVYNPSPASYSSVDCPSTLPTVKRQLTAGVKHVLLGDFNLHHPLWNDSTRTTQHASADQLLDVIEEANLSLTLPKGTITWEARQSFSTIDLVFMSDDLVARLEHCMSRPELNQSSDHIPISTRITLNSEPQTIVERRAWKRVNMEKLREAEKRAPLPFSPRSPDEIEAYTITIQEFLREVINATVPWARPSKYAKPFWNDECSVITKETRRLRRAWTNSRDLSDWITYTKSNHRKQKIIQKAKRLSFRKEIEKATESPMGLWRLAKWAKDKSEKPREIPKMPSLTRDDQIASTFEEKTEMLKQKFFPPAPPADLSDIEGSFYPSPPHCPTIVTRSEVTESIRRLKPDTAPGPDGITNRIVKACSEKLSDLLTPFFQACIDQAYHPRAFKTAKHNHTEKDRQR